MAIPANCLTTPRRLALSRGGSTRKGNTMNVTKLIYLAAKLLALVIIFGTVPASIVHWFLTD